MWIEINKNHLRYFLGIKIILGVLEIITLVFKINSYLGIKHAAVCPIFFDIHVVAFFFFLGITSRTLEKNSSRKEYMKKKIDKTLETVISRPCG